MEHGHGHEDAVANFKLIISQHSCEGTEEYHKNPSCNTQRTGRDSRRVPLECWYMNLPGTTPCKHTGYGVIRPLSVPFNKFKPRDIYL
jgi:hypothetical protein